MSRAGMLGTAAGWDDQAEVLRGSRQRLADAEDAAEAFGSRAAPAARAFAGAWLERARALAEAADRHAGALEEAADGYSVTDVAVSEQLGSLLPWGAGTGSPPPP